MAFPRLLANLFDVVGDKVTIKAEALPDGVSTGGGSGGSGGVIVGTGDQVFGIARIATGGGSGTWFHCDRNGEPVYLNEEYFNRHQIYANIVRTIIDGQIMVRVPKFYVKHVQSQPDGTLKGSKITWISPEPLDGYHLYPAFMNNGQEIDQFWLGSYKASMSTDNTMCCSLPGKAPAASKNFTTFKTLCEARNTGGVDGFMMQDVYQRHAIQLLMLAETANPNMQNIFGNGHVSGSAAVTVDHINNPKPWRGFYGLWGNVWEMVDGVRADSAKKLEIFRNDGTRAYMATNLSMTVYGSGWTGWITEMFSEEDAGYDLKDVFIPSASNGTEANGTYGDNHYGAVANGVCYAGGGWGDGVSAGLFCVTFPNAASDSGAGLGCRLAKV